MLSKRFARVLPIILAALMMLSGCAERNDSAMNDTSVAPINKNSPYLLLANKQKPLGATYAPPSLKAVPTNLTNGGKALELESGAADAAIALVRDLHAHGFTDIVITSAYRTYAYQEYLFNHYTELEQNRHPDWTAAQCREEVLTYSALPGTSEHQTGLCMDLISAKSTALDESFAAHPVYAYLCENAHRFGFILRYPKGKENVTGYTWEPWHYRYVGVDEATRIHAAGITLEEYVANG